MNNLKQQILEEFDIEFEWGQIFNSDNFEDNEHINHPCYSHAGVDKAFREFLSKALDRYAEYFSSEIRRDRDLQGQDGIWNMDPYMLGLYNGLELALSSVEDREPEFRRLLSNQKSSSEGTDGT